MALPLISYAQNGEDILLHRALSDVRHGFYVDIGAHGPVVDSVTKHFYDRGWRGINVEPGAIFEELSAGRPGDINLNLAVSDHDGEVTLYESPSNTGLSSLESTPIDAAVLAPAFSGPEHTWIDVAKRERAGRTVQATTLAAIFNEHAVGRTIDFLKIDVEGHEAAVLRSNDWHQFRPRVAVVEAVRPMSNEPAWDTWEAILLGAAYTFAFFDGLNRYYVREESPELLAAFMAPPNVLDGFISWHLVSMADRAARAESALAAATAVAPTPVAALGPLHEALADAHLRLGAAEERLRSLTEGTGTFGLPAAVMLARTVHLSWSSAQRIQSMAATRLQARRPEPQTAAERLQSAPAPVPEPSSSEDRELAIAAVAAAARKGRLGRYLAGPQEPLSP